MAHTSPIASHRERAFIDALIQRRTVRRASCVSIIVGSILIAINQGDLLMAGAAPPVWKVLLTYFVPYAVSSYSTAALVSEQLADRRRQC